MTSIIAHRLAPTLVPAGILVVLLTLAGVACDSRHPVVAAGCWLPAPVSATEAADPNPTVYYYILTADRPGEELLQSLLDAGFDVRNVWWPRHDNSCRCALCITAIVVELGVPNDAILGRGFTQANAVYNCGVADFDWYLIEGC